MISMLLFILTAFAARAPAGYMPMGPRMVPYFRRANGTFTTKTFTSPVPLLGDEVRIYAKSDAKAGDNMSEASTEAASSNVSECGSEFSSTWDALDGANYLHDKDMQQSAKDFFKERSAPENKFGSTVIVNLSNDVAKENKTLAKHIEEFTAKLKAIPDSGDYLDFQENPHMTVSAVIMDRNVDATVANEKFEDANTNVKAIQKALRTIEDKNVRLEVEADKALKIPNKAGQFSIQFNGKDQSASKKTTADFAKMENDVKFHLMKRLNFDLLNFDKDNFDKDMLSRAVKGLENIEKWKKEPKSMTEFQKVRFELIAKVGADVKDHFPAMALHIGQIKDPEALKRSEHQEKVAKLFADYKEIFARCTITMKGLQYVRYTSNSLKPESIKVLADANKTY